MADSNDRNCRVKILKEGYSYVKNGEMRANGTSTLIEGRNKTIIVDTLSPADKEILIQALLDNGVKPEDIDVVVGTHGHVDHIGNLNLFPQADQIIGFSISKGDVYYIHPFESGEPYKIDDDILVLPTPGHTLSDVSVVVSNVVGMGTVVIAGDLFERKEDIACPNLWREAGSENPQLQEQNRNKVLAMADYIIPGHGPMFKVEPEMKKFA